MPPKTMAPEVPPLVLEPSDRAPAAARRFVADRYHEWDKDDFTARLVVTELVTNAWQHGAGVIVVRVLRDGDAPSVVIEVWDQGTGRPIVQDEDAESTRGRGLLLMSELALEWGTRPIAEGGKIVWARCPL
ncbi:ATP-binding protein [Actinomadura adrarensis]|uniref:ATP-binding protein n=1 Tax=Actinomadura adrarensis TaxID=1819600 RepID=A0ABW3CSM8_9ACTN